MVRGFLISTPGFTRDLKLTINILSVGYFNKMNLIGRKKTKNYPPVTGNTK